MGYAEQYGEWGLVLGGSEGLGLALASELAARGVNVALVARRQGPLDDAARQISEQFGVKVRTLSADMTNPDIVSAIEQGFADIPEFGFLVYNCAGIAGGAEFLDISVDRHIENIVVNCITPTRIVHHFGGKMVQRKRGGVVLCTSLAALQGIYHWAGYGASKSYELILGESLWDEFRQHGVGATAFAIGATYTPNFQRDQKLHNTSFADTRTPEGLPDTVQFPQDPQDAAGNLFAQIDKEWLPRIYANPLDEQTEKLNATASRVDLINRMGHVVRSNCVVTD